ncbi:MAG: alpha/beta hydrolase [Ardenticatenaceae bacterium]
MGSIPTLPGITSEIVETPRLAMHVLFSGTTDGEPVLFVHGNASSATFWEETMLALPDEYWSIAPDLRGYGDTEDKRIDATRGMGDWVDDLLALSDTLGLDRFHVVGHSLGGAILYSLIATAGERILSATLVAPGSPYGFGGSKGPEGTPNYDDYTGSGGGIVNPDFARLIAEKDRGTDNPASPRTVMNAYYWKPPFRPKREEALLSSLLSEQIGEKAYPGDHVAATNWPNVAPGKWGPANALSPKYVGDSVRRFIEAPYKPPILWVRGADDLIVSDNSLFDFGTLGKLGVIPDWPGEEVYPSQPMVSQTRAVLDQYTANGGRYWEAVFPDTGHTPYLEQPQIFMERFLNHLRAAVG